MCHDEEGPGRQNDLSGALSEQEMQMCLIEAAKWAKSTFVFCFMVLVPRRQTTL